MLYPFDFYYNFKNSDPAYTFTPTGQLNVDKFLKSRPHWRKPTSPAQQKKKTLILADWTASGWDADRINTVKEVLEQLLKEGFEIYLWQDDKVIPLKEAHVICDDIMREKMWPPINDAAINAIINQCDLIKDQVKVLDDYWIQALIDQKFDQPRQLDSSYLNISEEKQKNILSMLGELTPKLEIIQHTEFSSTSNSAVREIEKLIPEIPINHKYRSLKISAEQMMDLINKQKFIDNGFTINLDELSQIESLEIASKEKKTFSAEDLNSLLIRTNQIKYLKFVNCIISGELKEDLNLKFLEELELVETHAEVEGRISISTKSLQNILASSKEIKKINFNHCEITGDELSHDLELNSLEELNLSSSIISTKSLQQILVHSKNLKKLNLWIIGITDDVLNDMNLTSLEELTLISTKNSLKPLVSAQNLRKLNLQYCTITYNKFCDLNLTSLEELNLLNARISDKSFKQILAHAKNLKKLSIDQKNLRLENPYYVFYMDNLNLESLEELNLTETRFNTESLNSIILNSKNLKIMNLSHCRIIGDLLYDLNLKSLEELNLSNTQTDIQSFHQNILARVQNLKKLNLHNATFCLSDDLNLKSLEELDLSKCEISAKDLGHIMVHAENLKKLNLCDFKINGDLLNDLNLKSLEELDLSDTKSGDRYYNTHTYISAKSFKHLLVNANKLKKLNLHKCKIGNEFSGELSDDLNLTSLEELNLSETSISTESLQHMLVHAQNLKKLNLNSCKIFGTLLNDLNLKSLEELDCSSIQNYSELNPLNHILVKAENLKKLNLSNCSIEDDLDLQSSLNLKLLEELDLSNTTISSKSLQHILAHAKKLKKLNLNNCKIKDDLLKDFNLISLEEFYLSGNSISLEKLQHILTQAKNLKKIKLDAYKITSDVLNSLNLDSLEELELSAFGIFNIQAESLQRIMILSTNLKKLKLHKITISGDSFGDLNLKSLEELVIANSSISGSSLQNILINILTHAKNIKKIRITNCEIIGSCLDDSQLAKLESTLKDAGVEVFISRNTINTSKDFKKIQPNSRPLKPNSFITDKKHIDHIDIDTLLEHLDIDSLPDNIDIDSLSELFSNSDNPYTKQLDPELLSRAFQTMGSFKNKEVLAHLLMKEVNSQSTFNESISTKIPKSANTFPAENNQSKTQSSFSESISNEIPNDSSKRITSDHLNPEPQRTDSTIIISADTTKKQVEFKLNQIFWGHNISPHPSTYRLSVHHHLNLNKNSVSENEAFKLDNPSNSELDLKLTDINIPTRSDVKLDKKWNNLKDNKNLYYGNIKLNLDEEWQALPSLSSNEKILDYHLDNPMTPSEIKYSQRDNLYYIRSKDKKTHTVNMDFLLESHVHEKEKLHDNLEMLLNHYSKFGEDPHSFKGPGTGQQYLDAINKAKTGACSHRSIALMDAIQNNKDKFGLPDNIQCRFVSNDCHAFVEIKLDTHSPWIAYDLGGYDAKLTIEKNNKPEQAEEIPFSWQNLFRLEGNHPNFSILPKPEFKPKKIYDENYFSRQLETWTKIKPQPESKLGFLQRLTNGKKKKQLIELSSTEQVQALALALENHCHHITRPVYYIHSPDDLICSAPYIKRKGNKGKLTAGKDGQGGPLHDFLTQNQDESNPPIVIINYDRFDADDIVRLNSILDDKNPRADGTPIGNANVIGLINPKKRDCYQGEDFYSRFGVGNVSTCPFSREELSSLEPIQKKEEKDDKVYTINLFHAPDWEERLLGRWQIKGDGLFFEEGLLSEALNSGFPIEIQNGPWDDPSFRHFWDRARTLPQIKANDESFKLSKSKFIKSEGYPWDALKSRVIFDREMKDDAPVLNPSKLSEFFHRYQCDSENHLDTLIGLIEANQNNSLHVNLTRSISDDDWAEILMQCEKYHVALHCHVAPSAALPNIFGKPEPYTSPIPSDIVIESTDIDVTISKLISKDNDNYKIIDVSELSGNDLLTKLSGKINKKTEDNKEKVFFEFTQSDCALTKALANNEKVILRGRFSPELADALAPLLLQNQKNLHLVTSDASNLNYVGVESHAVTVAEKIEALISTKIASKEEILALDNLETIPFCKARARLLCSHLRDPWKGLKGLSGGIKLNAFDEKNSKEISEAFIKKRLDGINTILEKSPYVFITGLTGVGKSTFVEKYLGTKEKPVYIGEAKIKEWANDHSEGLKLLFIDEANITSREWSEFHGLFDDPPSIMIDGEYQTLSRDHKVIFAGNPLNYGGERKMAPLFENNGNALVFKPMPPEFIYEAILKPIFVNTSIENHSLTISREILNIYRFLCECSSEEVMISPRELQMMALMVLSHAEKNPHDDIEMITRHYGILIARSLVPQNHTIKFDEQFPAPDLKRSIKKQPKDFVLTPSREPLYQHLSDLLALRKYRINLFENNPDAAETESAKLYGGLGGIVIEGEPGVGKSELVIAHLVAHGFEEVKLDTHEVHKKSFYRMPISMQSDEKERLLLKAFDEGAIVIVDEINSAPMMERLLNDLLMSKKPNGDRPKNPGFMIVGTQNPAVTMAGRQKPSNALKRRITTVQLPPYPNKELNSILDKLGVKEKYATKIITAYQKNLEQAKQKKLTPAPTMRDLKRVAIKWIKKVQKKINKKPIQIQKRKPSNQEFPSSTFINTSIPTPQNKNQNLAELLDEKEKKNKEKDNGKEKEKRKEKKIVKEEEKDKDLSQVIKSNIQADSLNNNSDNLRYGQTTTTTTSVTHQPDKKFPHQQKKSALKAKRKFLDTLHTYLLSISFAHSRKETAERLIKLLENRKGRYQDIDIIRILILEYNAISSPSNSVNSVLATAIKDYLLAKIDKKHLIIPPFPFPFEQLTHHYAQRLLEFVDDGETSLAYKLSSKTKYEYEFEIAGNLAHELMRCKSDEDLEQVSDMINKILDKKINNNIQPELKQILNKIEREIQKRMACKVKNENDPEQLKESYLHMLKNERIDYEVRPNNYSRLGQYTLNIKSSKHTMTEHLAGKLITIANDATMPPSTRCTEMRRLIVKTKNKIQQKNDRFFGLFSNNQLVDPLDKLSKLKLPPENVNYLRKGKRKA